MSVGQARLRPGLNADAPGGKSRLTRPYSLWSTTLSTTNGRRHREGRRAVAFPSLAYIQIKLLQAFAL